MPASRNVGLPVLALGSIATASCRLALQGLFREQKVGGRVRLFRLAEYQRCPRRAKAQKDTAMKGLKQVDPSPPSSPRPRHQRSGEKISRLQTPWSSAPLTEWTIGAVPRQEEGESCCIMHHPIIGRMTHAAASLPSVSCPSRLDKATIRP